jgi:hypothetical protein
MMILGMMILGMKDGLLVVDRILSIYVIFIVMIQMARTALGLKNSLIITMAHMVI